MKYTDDLIEGVKKLYPEQKEMIELAENGELKALKCLYAIKFDHIIVEANKVITTRAVLRGEV